MVEYHDLTIRDGCHAISHKLTADMIKKHCLFVEKSKIPVMEIGHGNGLGASSILIGRAALSDVEMISLAKSYLKNTKIIGTCHTWNCNDRTRYRTSYKIGG